MPEYIEQSDEDISHTSSYSLDNQDYSGGYPMEETANFANQPEASLATVTVDSTVEADDEYDQHVDDGEMPEVPSNSLVSRNGLK